MRPAASGLVCLTLAACGDTVGEAGSARGSFDSAVVSALFGSLLLTLSDRGGGCGNWEDRDAFFRRRGLWVRLLAVDQVSLTPRGGGFAYEVTPGDETLSALNEFLAIEVSELAPGRTPDLFSTPEVEGEIGLASVPDYDTGAVVGSYDFMIDGTEYAGSFETSYCPTSAGVDPGVVARDLYEHCAANFFVPYQPEASSETLPRDLERSILAIGLSLTEAECFATVIDTYCKNPPPSFWPSDDIWPCVNHELAVCRGYPEPGPSACRE